MRSACVQVLTSHLETLIFANIQNLRTVMRYVLRLIDEARKSHVVWDSLSDDERGLAFKIWLDSLDCGCAALGLRNPLLRRPRPLKRAS